MGSDSREERTLELLAERRNRELLAALREADGLLSTRELAERLGPDVAPTAPPSDPGSALEAVRLSLHHDRLPRLADAGLVEYDPEATRASAAAPDGDAEWVPTETADGERADAEWVTELLDQCRATGALGESAVGVVEGRERIGVRGCQSTTYT